ncbi:hypothetical protein [Jiella mangrovi]|uniref:Uncharacterized protein n=1 Tax=Jiella mangrovi TaxID=2821407 RepID=A0ABS4BEA4_9HYPH|nr:hypothetical protein [Jiella mangrovi]MBP0615092.1 hypothetical protein [Jiella mangrovi]
MGGGRSAHDLSSRRRRERIASYLDHLGDSQQRRWDDLGTPTLTKALRAKLIAETLSDADGKNVSQLAVERDAKLVEVVESLRSK